MERNDNYFIILPHPAGGFAAVEGYTSYDVPPKVSYDDDRYDTIFEAIVSVENLPSAYGTTIDKSCFLHVDAGIDGVLDVEQQYLNNLKELAKNNPKLLDAIADVEKDRSK